MEFVWVAEGVDLTELNDLFQRVRGTAQCSTALRGGGLDGVRGCTAQRQARLGRHTSAWSYQAGHGSLLVRHVAPCRRGPYSSMGKEAQRLWRALEAGSVSFPARHTHALTRRPANQPVPMRARPAQAFLNPLAPHPTRSQVGFPQRDPFKLQIALQNTYATVWVRSARKSRLAKQGQLLGFARATSDGALSATIWDVAVSGISKAEF